MATAKGTKGTRKTAPAIEAQSSAVNGARDYGPIRDEIAAELRRNVDLWLPRTLDEKGGFHQSFDRDWKRPRKDEPRFSVFQARMTWLAATAISIFPERAEEFARYARHGFEFLSSRQWDSERGGFYDHVSREGKPVTEGIGQIKSIYGNSFGLYALAAMYRACSDLFALDLGFESFEWIDSYAHDDVHGGYFNVVSLDGRCARPAVAKATDETKMPGIKSMNAHIHLLESFTELLRAAPHIVVRERVEEVLGIVRDRIATPDGYLVERLTEDWRPLSETTSFGHDVETAYLLLDAAQVLGTPNDEKTLQTARGLVDHAIQFGWNAALGSLADSADLKGRIIDGTSKWWASAEALNAFLLMHELFGAETDRYWEAFAAQWAFIKNHHIDSEHGGWFVTVGPDGTPAMTHKADPWKEAYHETRAMMHVVERLDRLAAAGS